MNIQKTLENSSLTVFLFIILTVNVILSPIIIIAFSLQPILYIVASIILLAAIMSTL